MLDTLRFDTKEGGEMCSQERARDHETSTDDGEIYFGYAEGGRNDDGACQVGGALHARHVVCADCAEDAGPTVLVLAIWNWMPPGPDGLRIREAEETSQVSCSKNAAGGNLPACRDFPFPQHWHWDEKNHEVG